MPSGGYFPFPERYGGPGDRRLQRILEALNAARGSGYDTSSESNVWVENFAFARAISAAWGTNRRLAHQWDPQRMTSLLSRWETILGLSPLSTDTEGDRRARIERHMLRFGEAGDQQYISDNLRRILGDVFVAVEYVAASSASITVPNGTYSFGTANTDYPWTSTVCRILIRTQKPSSYTEREFYDAVDGVHPFLDSVLPAWCTWQWYRPGSTSATAGGGSISAAGFYLDDEHNLDNEVFD